MPQHRQRHAGGSARQQRSRGTATARGSATARAACSAASRLNLEDQENVPAAASGKSKRATSAAERQRAERAESRVAQLERQLRMVMEAFRALEVQKGLRRSASPAQRGSHGCGSEDGAANAARCAACEETAALRKQLEAAQSQIAQLQAAAVTEAVRSEAFLRSSLASAGRARQTVCAERELAERHKAAQIVRDRQLEAETHALTARLAAQEEQLCKLRQELAASEDALAVRVQPILQSCVHTNIASTFTLHDRAPPIFSGHVLLAIARRHIVRLMQL